MRKVDLLNGSIAASLMRLALPIMGTSLVQMAYNLIDMIWIGRLSADAVAAVGAAGMYLWISFAFSTVPRIGSQVKSAQALGAGDIDKAAGYAQAAFHMGAVLMILLTAFCIVLHPQLIGFFQAAQSKCQLLTAEIYLIVISFGYVFTFTSQILTGLFTAIGASSIVFRSTAVGLVANAILDPLFIFGIGPFPELRVAGAALATVMAQGIVCLMFVIAGKKRHILFLPCALI